MIRREVCPLSGPGDRSADTPARLQAVLALDVGGTTVDGAVVGTSGDVAGEVRRVASPEDEDASGVVDCLAGLLSQLRSSPAAAGLLPIAAGLGMPGPFDYARGVSHMRHKLAAVRGVDLRTPLEAAVGLPVRFVNDATAFALGAWWREHPDESHLVGVTVGTGLGSGFVVDGRPAGEGEGVPAGGELWRVPFRGGIFEDAVSGRALQASYERSTGTVVDVGEIAARARAGDAAGLEAFALLGDALGEGLAATITGFQPTHIVCGGGIAQAFDLFGTSAQEAYARSTGTDVVFSRAIQDHLALVGVTRHVLSEVS